MHVCYFAEVLKPSIPVITLNQHICCKQITSVQILCRHLQMTCFLSFAKWHNKDNCKRKPNPSEQCLHPVIIYTKPITLVTNFVVFFRYSLPHLYECLSIITHPKFQQIWIRSIQPQTNLLRKRWKIQDSSSQIHIFRKLTSNPPNSCIEEESISSIWSRQPRNRSSAFFTALTRQTQVDIYMADL